jgi:hypothetical protein
MLGLHAIVAVKDGVLAADVGDEIVLLDMASGQYCNLQDVAAEIWKKLASPLRVAELCAQLGEAYDAPPERIEASVVAYLGQLAERGLIDVR